MTSTFLALNQGLARTGLKDKNVFHLLDNSNRIFIENIVRKSQGFNHPEIDVIPSHISLIANQAKIKDNAAVFARLARKLEKVNDQYDIVIIDAPPALDLYARIALIAADYLIIPSDLKPFSNQGLDIERVTLVGIMAADGLLYHSDYRASERAFQTLTQVAGRAGRGRPYSTSRCRKLCMGS